MSRIVSDDVLPEERLSLTKSGDKPLGIGDVLQCRNADGRTNKVAPTYTKSNVLPLCACYTKLPFRAYDIILNNINKL